MDFFQFWGVQTDTLVSENNVKGKSAQYETLKHLGVPYIY